MTASKIRQAALELIEEHRDEIELAALCGLDWRVAAYHEDDCPRLAGTGECTCSRLWIQLVHVGPDPELN